MSITITWVGAATENFHVGRAGYLPVGVVIHLMDGSLTGTDSWFNNPTAQVSAHYGIGKTGQVHQYVREEDRAFHAGRVQDPTFPLLNEYPDINPNDYLIGIEHEGTVDDEWSTDMVQASAELLAQICKRWNIPCNRDHVARHHEIFAPKPCPGPKCPIDDIVAQAAALLAAGDAPGA